MDLCKRFLSCCPKPHFFSSFEINEARSTRREFSMTVLFREGMLTINVNVCQRSIFFLNLQSLMTKIKFSVKKNIKNAVLKTVEVELITQRSLKRHSNYFFRRKNT